MMVNYQERRFIYGRVFRFFHWTVASCIFLTLAMISIKEYIDDAGLYKQLIAYHRSLGIVILCLVVLRLAWRLFSRDLPYTGVSPLIQLVASISHAVLYLSLLAMSFLGWMETSARNKPIQFFDYTLPNLLAKNMQLAEQLQEWHIALGKFFIVFIFVHIASALWHYFWRKDGVLYAMIPVARLRRPWQKNLNSDDLDKESL
jgi:cytochrome b561